MKTKQTMTAYDEIGGEIETVQAMGKRALAKYVAGLVRRGYCAVEITLESGALVYTSLLAEADPVDSIFHECY